MRTKDLIAYNLEQALGEGSCPVCRCLATATNRYLTNLLYEFVNDPRTRDQLRACGGFCREHAWVLQRMGDPLAHSIIYADLIDAFRADLHQTTVTLRGLTAEKVPVCPVCQEEAAMQKRYVGGLLGALHESDFREKYRELGCLCLPHFRAVYDQARNKGVRVFLGEVQSNRLSELSSELQEFIRKSDYRYAHELPGTERDAWIRAVRFWVGPLESGK